MLSGKKEKMMTGSEKTAKSGAALLLCLILLFAMTGCGGGDASEESNPRPKKAPAVKKAAEDPLAAEKAEISAMDAQQVLDYINNISEPDCSLEYKDDNAMWIIAENGNGANVKITHLIHQKFTKDEKEFHKYGFGIAGGEGLYLFYTEEENHPLMLYALEHLHKLAKAGKSG
jgi:hypothetical protein